MQKMPLIALVAATVLLSACSDRIKDTHPQQLVSKRQAVFKKFTKALEPMGLVARDRQDYVKASFVASAQALQELASQPWPYFTADGNYPPTRAKPEVWSQAGEFKLAQDKFLAATDALVQVAGSADVAAIRTSVEAVQTSCKSCHDQFRFDRQ
ncbi:cytochrome c [Rhodoferax sp.]|uniref:c-type cytochrome n=1 Tax=Rhodoferax sp. TaxID=50421 RepID=UPI002614EB99|nr:cytochrome c [Rhodoferax sp.]MDD2918207.1 cytochrome c [Rhodoferax sp.]